MFQCIVLFACAPATPRRLCLSRYCDFVLPIRSLFRTAALSQAYYRTLIVVEVHFFYYWKQTSTSTRVNIGDFFVESAIVGTCFSPSLLFLLHFVCWFVYSHQSLQIGRHSVCFVIFTKFGAAADQFTQLTNCTFYVMWEFEHFTMYLQSRIRCGSGHLFEDVFQGAQQWWIQDALCPNASNFFLWVRFLGSTICKVRREKMRSLSRQKLEKRFWRFWAHGTKIWFDKSGTGAHCTRFHGTFVLFHSIKKKKDHSMNIKCLFHPSAIACKEKKRTEGPRLGLSFNWIHFKCCWLPLSEWLPLLGSDIIYWLAAKRKLTA